MSDRMLNAVACAVGAAAGYLFSDWYERRRAERRSLTDADQKWMAATHEGSATPHADRLAAMTDAELIEEAARHHG
jgi:hypothetical protein